MVLFICINIKFRHNSLDTLNPLCSFSLEPETSLHFLLGATTSLLLALPLMNDLDLIDSSISQISETALANIPLHGYLKKGTAKFCRQSIFINHSSKHLSYVRCFLFSFSKLFHDSILYMACKWDQLSLGYIIGSISTSHHWKRQMLLVYFFKLLMSLCISSIIHLPVYIS